MPSDEEIAASLGFTFREFTESDTSDVDLEEELIRSGVVSLRPGPPPDPFTGEKTIDLIYRVDDPSATPFFITRIKYGGEARHVIFNERGYFVALDGYPMVRASPCGSRNEGFLCMPEKNTHLTRGDYRVLLASAIRKI